MADVHKLSIMVGEYGGTFREISGSRFSHENSQALARLGKRQVLKVSIPDSGII